MAEHSLGSVVLLGFGTVFVGLILLILVTKLTGFLIGGRKEKTSPEKGAAPVSGGDPRIAGDKGAFIAAVAAAVAQCLGTDVNGIRILSVKRVNKGEEYDA